MQVIRRALNALGRAGTSTAYRQPGSLPAPGPADAVSEEQSERARWRLGRLAPAVLVAWLVVDVGLRAMPVERLGVSPIVAAQRFAGRRAPFRANVSIHVPAGSPGENAVRGNLPPTERRPPLQFSTDALGYRRNPEVPVEAVIDLLFLGGDSFIYGANLSDEETLPAAFTRASGLLSYNGGRPHLIPTSLADLDWLLSRFSSMPKRAVLVHLEQHRRRLPKLGLDSGVGVIADLKYARYVASGWWDAAPLSNATRRLFRHLADDKILPNTYGQDILAYTLPDGRPMLFRGSETFPSRRPQTGAEIRGTAQYIVQWVRTLEARGLETHVLLLPTRFTVYGPWLELGELRAGVLQAVQDFHALEAALRDRNVSTTNGLHVFQATAERDLRTGELPFYREDNHWTPEGVERIARALADSLSPSNRDAHGEPMVQAAPGAPR